MPKGVYIRTAKTRAILAAAKIGSKGNHYTHGKSYTPAWISWQRMKTRCTNSKSNRYPRYGGRGITVCERWLVFANFYEDMGERPEGTSLDRYPNPDGNYEPDNCRWATPSEQQRNKSKEKK